MADIPGDVQARLKRGKDKKNEDSGKRKEAWAFWRNQQYKWVNSQGAIQSQATTTDYDRRSGKPAHRARTSRNYIFDVVEHEVALSVQRVPSYEINPSTSDPEDISAARLAEKVALYGYDKWHLRAVTEAVVRYAVISAEGFAWPYFDNTVGPYISDGIGQGEINVRIFGGDEVGWEPGLSFDESRWHFIEQARDIEQVKQLDGFIGKDLKADAEGDQKLVMVTEYLERPSAQKPEGRWITIANGKVIIEERAYPCTDPSGEPIDEPVLHKLSYAMDPNGDRDQGLVPYLLDAQRTANDCVNKQIEWKNLAMNPQVIIWNGGFAKGQRLNDVPGTAYQAFGSGKVEWRPVPPMPVELSNMKADAQADIGRIAAQNDIPSNVDSARGIEALIERDSNRRSNFVSSLAEFHSRLMRHCLYLVQKHYTEERLLTLRGLYGPDNEQDFLGAKLRSQVDVTVLPGSIEPRTRAQIEQKIIAFADRQWITPEAAMAAINGGTAENLVRSYELDVARAWSVVRKIKAGPEVLFSTPPRQPFTGEDPGVQTNPDGSPMMDANGQPVMNQTIPGWMPRPFDRISVWRGVFEDWMKGDDYDRLDSPSQEAANQVYDALLQVESRQQAQAAQAQTEMAQGLGMANAAKPQGATPMPDQKSPNGNQTGQLFGPRYQFGQTKTF